MKRNFMKIRINRHFRETNHVEEATDFRTIISIVN